MRTDITQIYDRHAMTVYAVCYNYMKSSHDAEDMTAETFCRLMTANPQFESVGHEKAWLIRTASNLCKNSLRHWWRKRLPPDEAGDAAVHTQDVDETLQAVLDLPKKYRTAVYLRYYEDCTAAEIAEMLGKNHSTIRNWLSEARALLKERLVLDE